MVDLEIDNEEALSARSHRRIFRIEDVVTFRIIVIVQLSTTLGCEQKYSASANSRSLFRQLSVPWTVVVPSTAGGSDVDGVGTWAEVAAAEGD